MRWVVLALIASACGRYGFARVGPNGGDDGNGDDGNGSGTACVTKTFNISQTSIHSGNPTVAWNGAQLGVAWIEDPTGVMTGSFRATMLDGTLGAEHDMIAMPMGERDIAIVDDAGTFRLALGALQGAHRQVFTSTNGSPPNAITSSGKDNFRPRLAALGGNATSYVFTESAGGSNYNAYLAVLDGGGTKVTNDVQVVASIGGPYDLDVDYDGSALTAFYYVGNFNGGNITVTRFDTSGNVLLAPKTLAASADLDSIAVAWTGTNHLLTWVDTTSTVHIVYVAADGTLATPIVHEPSGVFGFYAAPFVGPTSDAVVWSDVGNMITYVVPMNRNGTAGTVATIADSNDATGSTKRSSSRTPPSRRRATSI